MLSVPVYAHVVRSVIESQTAPIPATYLGVIPNAPPRNSGKGRVDG